MAARSIHATTKARNAPHADASPHAPPFAESSTRIKQAVREPERIETDADLAFFAEFAEVGAVPTKAVPHATPPLPSSVARIRELGRSATPPPLPQASSVEQRPRATALVAPRVAAPSHDWVPVTALLGLLLAGSWLWLGLDYPAHLISLQTTLHGYAASALR